MEPLYIILIYLAAISLVSVIVTVYDKIASKNLPRHRTREATLLILSALGGSVFMFITMLIIRHKTKHIKFMLGIPVIILVQVAAMWALLHFGVIPV